MMKEDRAKKHLERGNHLAWIEGKTAAAIEEFRTALQLHPTLAAAQLQIGSIFFHDNQMEQAMTEFHEVIRLSPDWSEGHYLLALTYEKTGRREDANYEFR